MPNLTIGRFSLISLFAAGNAFLALSYIALIAVVMSYAALHVEFAQQVRNDEATVASLEAAYLGSLSRITATDYASSGYSKPVAKIYVAGGSQTALNTR